MRLTSPGRLAALVLPSLFAAPDGAAAAEPAGTHAVAIAGAGAAARTAAGAQARTGAGVEDEDRLGAFLAVFGGPALSRARDAGGGRLQGAGLGVSLGAEIPGTGRRLLAGLEASVHGAGGEEVRRRIAPGASGSIGLAHRLEVASAAALAIARVPLAATGLHLSAGAGPSLALVEARTRLDPAAGQAPAALPPARAVAPGIATQLELSWSFPALDLALAGRWLYLPLEVTGPTGGGLDAGAVLATLGVRIWP